MVARLAIDKLVERLERLEGILDQTGRPFARVLDMALGEDRSLVARRWAEENPDEPEPAGAVVYWVFDGAQQRPELCSRNSLEDAIPTLRGLEELGGDYPGVRQARELCEDMDIDWLAVSPASRKEVLLGEWLRVL